MNNSSTPSPQPCTVDATACAFREGFNSALSTFPGVFAWALVTGMAMVKSGLTVGQALGMTLVVYAGSAQLAGLPLIAAHAPVWMVFVTALVVNVRFLIFGAAVAPYFAHARWHKRIFYGYLNGDVIMGLFPWGDSDARKYSRDERVRFYRGMAYPSWAVWQSGSVLGILLGSQIPQSWGIGFAGTLALLGITIPLVVNTAVLAGVAVAAVIAVAAADLPYRLGLLVAVGAAMAVAMAVDAFIERHKARNKEHNMEKA